MSAKLYWQNKCVREFSPPKSLIQLLQETGIQIDTPCGGSGVCLKCRIQVQGALSPLTPMEADHLTRADIERNIRLACFTQALGNVWAMPSSTAQPQILSDLHMPPLGACSTRHWGLVVDIGTTTVVAYLFPPGAQFPCKVVAAPNPQSVYGADVISRLGKAVSGYGPILQNSIIQCVKDLTGVLCSQMDLRAGAIQRAVFTGNTAMLYLLMGRNPLSLTRAPFHMDEPFGIETAGELFGLPGCQVYLPRCISAYVGADMNCAILAAQLFANKHPSKETLLLVDIGTNGEMALAHNGKLYVCSTAAGPAFEGAGIEMGMTARPGAIHRVWKANDRVSFDAIAGENAAGLCGTGIVDAISVLLELGIIDETGYMQGGEFLFPGTHVRLTQKDVRQIQLAKAAICAGMMTLMKTAGISAGDVGQLRIAGGFGNCIDPVSAQRIGLIPLGLACKAAPIGNGAGAGAAMALLYAQCRQDLECAAKLCRVIELSTDSYFLEQYVNQMGFEEV